MRLMQKKMDRHTTCNGPKSMSKQDQKKHIVRTMEFSHKDLEDGAPDDINSKDSQKGCRLQIVPLRQQVKTIKIPRAMKNEAFLKHPDLTMGQKRYLCSIASIYSTSNMRALTEKHLHSKIKCGSKKVHLNRPHLEKRKNDKKEHCRRVHTATTTTEASRTVEDMLEKITSLSMNETNCDG